MEFSKKRVLFSWSWWEQLGTRKDYRSKYWYNQPKEFKKKVKTIINRQLRKKFKWKDFFIKWWDYKKVLEYKYIIY